MSGADDGVPPSKRLKGDVTHASGVPASPTKAESKALIDGNEATAKAAETIRDCAALANCNRATEERDRVLSEKVEERRRVRAERERALAEVLAERDRVFRVLAEQDRVPPELYRVRAEQDRALAEQKRVLAEQDRVLAEQDRVLAEQDRVLAEQDRVLAEQDRALAEQDRVLAEQDRLSSEKDRVLPEQDRVLAEQDRVLAEQDRVLAEQYRESDRLKRFLAEKDKAAKRQSLQTLVALEKNQFVLKRLGKGSLPVNGTRTSASAIEKEFVVSSFKDNSKIRLGSVSRILLKLVDQNCGPPLKFKVVPVFNKADVIFLVRDLLDDVADILGYLGFDTSDMTNFQEPSLFSGRQDILVVRSSAYHLPFLVVKVTNPVVDVQLCDNEEALGQAYDCVESLRAFGHPDPVVVLTTLEESCVCWTHEDEDRTGNRYAEGLNITPTCPSNDEQDLSFEPMPERKLNRSKVFEAYQLVHVLCTVFRSALQSTKPNKNDICDLRINSTYSFSKVLRFTAKSDSYTWGSLRVCVGSPIHSRVQKSNNNQQKHAKNQQAIDDDDAYYLIGILGRGWTSNVWQALDSTGKEVVIKMYVNTPGHNSCYLDSQGLEDEGKRIPEEEADKLRRFYQFSETEVYHIKLSGFHCIVMPFFSPVPKEKRNDTLPAVEEVLKDVFGPQKLKYDEEDQVRWGHVGFFGPNRVILYSLSYLEPVEDENTESWVQTHCDILRDMSGWESEPELEQFECEHVSAEGGEKITGKFKTE